MLSAYIQFNGPEEDELFQPYVFGPAGFFTLWDERRPTATYGAGIDCLLFGFCVAGRFDYHMPEKITLGRYTPSNRSICIEVPVTRADFHDCNDRERRLFISHAIEFGVELAADRHRGKKDTDFDRLLKDIADTARIYLPGETTRA